MKTLMSSPVMKRIILCLLILAAGFSGFLVLQKMKKPPQQVEAKERALPVEVVQVKTEQVPVVVSGYGEIRSRSVVPLSAEVSGRITSIHDNLEVGAVIARGEVLCTIDERDYRLEFESARTRLQTLSRDLELARKEFSRVSGLYKKNKVGTLSSVEKAEQAMNGINNQLSQVRQAMELAGLRLERCVIRAPFTCRITECRVEKGEYVSPGKELLTLVDDADLEVLVSLDSSDGVKWLRFQPSETGGSWFGRPEETACTITWTEDDRVRGSGRLDRVVRYDSANRTLVVAVHLDPDKNAFFPLVQGMFCRVAITGRSLESVVVLPAQAVSFEGTVYVVQDNRLHSRRVETSRVQDGKALVTGGLASGETVIITRLENPLENRLVQVEPVGTTPE